MWMSGVMVVFGLALIFQSSRWSNTPSYANLLLMANTFVWGLVYLLIGTLLIVASRQLHRRWLYVLAHTAAIALVASWLLSFIVRWLTDDGTTIVNVVSWATYLFLLVRSVIVIESMFNQDKYERR